MGKHVPIIAKPVTNEEVIAMFSNEENLEDLAWTFSDWVEVADWLTKQGSPQYTPEGNWNPMVERVKWVIENGKPV